MLIDYILPCLKRHGSIEAAYVVPDYAIRYPLTMSEKTWLH